MNKLLWLLLLPTTLLAQPRNIEAFKAAEKLGRGVNILGYDRIWEDRAHGRFQPKYFRLLKEAGFAHVRLNLMPFRLMNATNGYALPPAWFGTLDWVIQLAREQKLQVVLDLHEFTALGEDPAAHKAQFLAFWRQVSEHCRNEREDVLFEILNEPSKKLTPELWNEFLRDALALIRETNPRRSVIVGPAFWNAIDHLAELELPDKDRHLIVTIHYYLPFAFTHQGASWAGLADKIGFDWQGTEAELGTLNAHFDQAAAWGKQHQRPLYLGEFGAYDKAPMESRARYTAAVARAAEARGWSWAYWQFERDFFLYDVKQDVWVEPILHALIPPQNSAGRKSPR